MAFTFKFVAELDYKQKGYNGKETRQGTVDFTFPGTLNFTAACGSVCNFEAEDIRKLLEHFDAEKTKWTPPTPKKKVTVKKKIEVKKK